MYFKNEKSESYSNEWVTYNWAVTDITVFLFIKQRGDNAMVQATLYPLTLKEATKVWPWNTGWEM